VFVDEAVDKSEQQRKEKFINGETQKLIERKGNNSREEELKEREKISEEKKELPGQKAEVAQHGEINEERKELFYEEDKYKKTTKRRSVFG